MRQRVPLDEHAFVEMVAWELPNPVPGSPHCYKYRLAYVVDGVCVMRFDNESGKGDHRHLGDEEHPVTFSSLDALLNAFWAEVDTIRAGGRHEDTDD